MDEIDKILDSAIPVLFSYEKEDLLKRAALKSYLLLAFHMGINQGLEEARQIIMSGNN